MIKHFFWKFSVTTTTKNKVP